MKMSRCKKKKMLFIFFMQNTICDFCLFIFGRNMTWTCSWQVSCPELPDVFYVIHLKTFPVIFPCALTQIFISSCKHSNSYPLVTFTGCKLHNAVDGCLILALQWCVGIVCYELLGS